MKHFRYETVYEEECTSGSSQQQCTTVNEQVLSNHRRPHHLQLQHHTLKGKNSKCSRSVPPWMRRSARQWAPNSAPHPTPPPRSSSPSSSSSPPLSSSSPPSLSLSSLSSSPPSYSSMSFSRRRVVIITSQKWPYLSIVSNPKCFYRKKCATQWRRRNVKRNTWPNMNRWKQSLLRYWLVAKWTNIWQNEKYAKAWNIIIYIGMEYHNPSAPSCLSSW